MGNIFKLDYCTEVRCDCFEFAYNGIRGFMISQKMFMNSSIIKRHINFIQLLN